MPISGQTVGRDISLQFNTSQGQLIIPANFITNFEASPDAKMLKYLGVTGIINPLVFHEGHEIRMEIARVSNALEQFWAVLEASYYAGIDLPSGTILQTITEKNGTVTQYVFTNVQLKVDTFGDYSGNNYVSQKLSGYAARREPLT